MNKLRLFLIRHGESLGNIDHNNYRLFSNRDIPLSLHGEFQAYDLGMKLAEKIRAEIRGDGIELITSPFLRAQETARLIHMHLDFGMAKNAEKQIRTNPHIYEMIWSPDKNGGCFTEPALVARYRADVQNYKFPRGESALDVYRRANKFLNCLISDHSAFEQERCNLDQSLDEIHHYPIRLVISHELFIAHFLAMLGHLGIVNWDSIKNLQISNASCFQVTIDLEKRKAANVTKIF